MGTLKVAKQLQSCVHYKMRISNSAVGVALLHGTPTVHWCFNYVVSSSKTAIVSQAPYYRIDGAAWPF